MIVARAIARQAVEVAEVVVREKQGPFEIDAGINLRADAAAHRLERTALVMIAGGFVRRDRRILAQRLAVRGDKFHRRIEAVPRGNRAHRLSPQAIDHHAAIGPHAIGPGATAGIAPRGRRADRAAD